MTTFIPFSRDQAFLLPPDARDWLAADDVAHFVVAAVERVPLGAFAVRPLPGGTAQYHPRLLLALLIYAYANGIFSCRRIERATHRDISVRHVAANLHPDQDTIASFRRANRAAFEAAFLRVLLLARESGLLRLGTVSIDGTRIDANASRIRSVRYDPAKELRAKLAAGDRRSVKGHIAELAARAEAADAEARPDPAEIAGREALIPEARRLDLCASGIARRAGVAAARQRKTNTRRTKVKPSCAGYESQAGCRLRPAGGTGPRRGRGGAAGV